MKEYFLVTCTLHVGFLSMRSPIRDCLDVYRCNCTYNYANIYNYAANLRSSQPNP